MTPLRLLLGADHRVRADDLLGLGVLDETLVVAVEQNLHAQLLALRVELAERQHAEAVDGGQLAGALVGVVVQEEVLGDGTGQRLLHHLVGHAVLVGVLGVANALVDPGVDHRLGGLAVRERLDVLLEALFVAFLDDGHSPLLMRLLPPPSTGAFSSTMTSWPHSSAPMSDAHMPAPP